MGNRLSNFLFICSNFIVSLQVICDANCRFLSINATKPGSCHNSTIFKSSTIGLKFARGQFGNGFLLGDSGYACATYLLTPYGNPATVQEVDLITFIYILLSLSYCHIIKLSSDSKSGIFAVIDGMTYI